MTRPRRHLPSKRREWREYDAGLASWRDAHHFDLDAAIAIARRYAPVLPVRKCQTLADVLAAETSTQEGTSRHG